MKNLLIQIYLNYLNLIYLKYLILMKNIPVNDSKNQNIIKSGGNKEIDLNTNVNNNENVNETQTENIIDKKDNNNTEMTHNDKKDNDNTEKNQNDIKDDKINVEEPVLKNNDTKILNNNDH